MAEKFLTITDYVVRLSRDFKLLPKRTTLLTYNEEIQLLQYCSAVHNKMLFGKFESNQKECEKLHSDSLHRRVDGLEAKIETHFLIKEEKEKDDENLNANLSLVNDHIQKTGEKFTVIEQEKEGDGNENKQDDTCEKEDPETIISQTNRADDSNSSVTSVFVESLKASNHCTLMDVFERFLTEVMNEESDLHSFAKSHFDMNVALGEIPSLQKVEILTVKVLKTIAEIEASDDQESRPSQSMLTETAHDLHSELPSPAGMMSPSTTRTMKTLRRISQKSPKTPVGIFKSKHQFSPVSATPFTPRNAAERQEVQKKFIENIFRCYLHLLVNTRCELALAFIFNIPTRDLDHEAFTLLKHASASCGLSMYQTMSSFLMRIRLGGHGYAPPSDTPLMFYVKGLGTLLDLLDKLQTYIEESASPRSACKRIVNILKRSISTCKSSKFPHAVVECVTNKVWDVLDDVLARMEKGDKEDNSEKKASGGGGVVGQESINAIQNYLDQSATSVSDVDRYLLEDVRFTQDTPTRFPSLMSQFRSPVADMGGEEEEEDAKDDETTQTTDAGSLRHSSFPVSEALYLSNEDNDSMICTPLDVNNLYVIPSKTIVHPKCGAEYDGELFSPEKIVSHVKRQRKRGPNKLAKKTELPNHVEDQENENAPAPKSLKRTDEVCDIKKTPKDAVNNKKKLSEGNKKQNKSCRRKLLPQVKGQSKLTGFFKV